MTLTTTPQTSRAPEGPAGSTPPAGAAQSTDIGGWWFAIIFFGWLGGLIGYFSLKETDLPRARRVAKAGWITTGVYFAISIVLTVALLASVSHTVSKINALADANQSPQSPVYIAPTATTLPAAIQPAIAKTGMLVNGQDAADWTLAAYAALGHAQTSGDTSGLSEWFISGAMDAAKTRAEYGTKFSQFVIQTVTADNGPNGLHLEVTFTDPDGATMKDQLWLTATTNDPSGKLYARSWQYNE